MSRWLNGYDVIPPQNDVPCLLLCHNTHMMLSGGVVNGDLLQIRSGSMLTETNKDRMQHAGVCGAGWLFMPLEHSHDHSRVCAELEHELKE